MNKAVLIAPYPANAISGKTCDDCPLTALSFLTRAFRTLRVLDERVSLAGYAGLVRQITVIDLGHEEPTILLTNNLRSSCPTLV